MAWGPTLCLGLVVVLTLAYTIAGAIVRPNMYSDSGWGFVGWYTQARASAFNYSLGPDLSDISREVEAFMSTWTPGQHVLPGLVEKLGMSLGLAIIVVVAAFSVLGLFGWHALYQAFGFPPLTIWVTLAVIVCNRFFNLSFTNYSGGESLLFGVAPWFILMVWRLRDFRWFSVIPFVLGTAVLVFAKLSGLIFGAAVVGGAAICGDRAWAKWDTLRKLVVAGIAIALMGAIFYFTWYTPAVKRQRPFFIRDDPCKSVAPFFLLLSSGEIVSRGSSTAARASSITTQLKNGHGFTRILTDGIHLR